LLHAARTDFVGVLRMPSTEISPLCSQPPLLFRQQGTDAGCAELVTFRGNADAEKIWQLHFQHRYFGCGEAELQPRFGGLVCCLLFRPYRSRKKQNREPIFAFGIALTAVGITFVRHLPAG